MGRVQYFVFLCCTVPPNMSLFRHLFWEVLVYSEIYCETNTIIIFIFAALNVVFHSANNSFYYVHRLYSAMAQMGSFSLVLPQCRTTYRHEIKTPQNFCHWLLVSAIHSTVNQDVQMVAYFEEWLTRSLSRHSVQSHSWRD